jgi:hypothetical protein
VLSRTANRAELGSRELPLPGLSLEALQDAILTR